MGVSPPDAKPRRASGYRGDDMKLDPAAVAAEYFGIAASTRPLPGEIDENLRLDVPDGSTYVLRLSPPRTDRDVLELQSEILSVLGRLDAVATPRPVPSLVGDEAVVLPDGRIARVFTWVEGVSFGAIGRPAGAAGSVGRTAGRIAALLATSEHPAPEREIEWDLRFASQTIRRHATAIEDSARRRMVLAVADQVDSIDFGDLPRQLVHNDLNDDNVLLDGEEVIGVIDVGDAMWSIRAGEAAIAATYVMLDQDDPVTAGGDVIRGFVAQVALNEAEAGVLLDLILARLATSVVMSAQRGSTNPHHTASEPLAWDLLERLTSADHDLVAGELATAAGHSRRRNNEAAQLEARRNTRLSPSLSLSYTRPLHIVRGTGAHLFDERGRRYLDAVNNVAQVGHGHPKVVAAAAQQMAVLNTNTRYLHEEVVRYADRLTATLPAPLEVVFLVNSGSEANELAIRLVRAATGAFDVVCLEHGYHGNTSTLIDVSPYKFNGPGGSGQRGWVGVLPSPDPYRAAAFRGDGAGERYREVAGAIVAGRGRPPAGLIAEALPGCAGQVVPAPGVMAAAYRAVGDAGGLVIADEVQTGFGRVGETFWAFELHDVVPDVVTMGKPIGNGHPLGAVVTTRAIAAAFDNGMEYFNTFGGNPVSASVGNAVLDVIEGEGLQANASRVGGVLMDGLRALAAEHVAIGDVRGAGLFIGAELVTDRTTQQPDPVLATQIVERAKVAGVLLSSDGPHHNVIKIKPPLVFTETDARRVIAVLAGILEAPR
jgi:4-aminobutyrate aminotransferase-like enzyme/Ser/Thr protein kinase RdoA (MazF antagonist)